MNKYIIAALMSIVSVAGLSEELKFHYGDPVCLVNPLIQHDFFNVKCGIVVSVSRSGVVSDHIYHVEFLFPRQRETTLHYADELILKEKAKKK